MRADLNIPHKANRILNLILLTFLLILMRVWYLAFVQQEYYEQQARKPQRKSVVQKNERATIRDRFNLPLSQNKIGYNATIRYADLREIPSHRWVKNSEGKKVKEPIRSLYITKLAETLAKELQLDAGAIEDIIYAKASLFPQTPFVIKESLTEKEYYRIRMLQKDFRGLEAETVSQRVYPFEKTACDVVGYMGAINHSEYLKIAEEIKELQEYIKKREAGEIVFLPRGFESPIEVRNRLKLLQEKAYTINDLVGKTGVERSCDELLRGIHGKKMYEIDPKGNILRQLPGSKKGVSGQRVFLSISAELQEYAEELLAQHETFRDMKDKNGHLVPGLPWIKGGAIVAMDPKTGEILTLASYPRFNPNDFSSFSTENKKEKQKSIRRWLENETHVGEIWDGKTALTRETYSLHQKKWGEEVQPLNWNYFLSTILPPGSSIEKALKEILTVKNGYLLLKHFEKLREDLEVEDPVDLIQALYFTQPHIAGKKKSSPELLDLIRQRLIDKKEDLQKSVQTVHLFLQSVSHNDDKLLVLDLVRLVVYEKSFDDLLIEKIGHFTLAEFLDLAQSLKKIEDELRDKMWGLHHNLGFKEWREKHFKAFLKQKRKEEKEQKKYAKPYIEYLEKIEKSLFKNFWGACKYFFLDALIYPEQRVLLEEQKELAAYFDVLNQRNDLFLLEDLQKLRNAFKGLSPQEVILSLKSMRSFEDLNRPLYGKYRQLRNTKGVQLEKHLAASFYPLAGFGYGRSQAFRQSTPQGSVFKIAIGYEALKERYLHLKENHLSLKDLNPLTIIDQIQMNTSGSLKQLLGYTLEGEPIRRLYKGGILPRTHPNIGKIDFVSAVEQSSNIYFSLLAAEHVEDPSLLEKMTKEMGLGVKTGIDLPGEIAGTIPNDLADNKTGLYSFAIGQHSLIVTPLQTALMYASFANKGEILKPQIVHLTVGKKNQEQDPFSLNMEGAFPFQDSLALAGIGFPLFTESLLPCYDSLIHRTPIEVKNSIFLPEEIRNLILKGMERVITGPNGTAKSNIIRYLREFPESGLDYKKLQRQLIGKTGTAEIFHKQWLDHESKAEIRNHIWFAGILFSEDAQSEPDWDDAELVIIVYLRFSHAGGKEAAPLAAQIGAKWREIQKKFGANSYIDSLSLKGKQVSRHLETKSL